MRFSVFQIMHDGMFAKYINDKKVYGDLPLISQINWALQWYAPSDGDIYFYLKDYFLKKYPHSIVIAEKDNNISISANNIEY